MRLYEVILGSFYGQEERFYVINELFFIGGGGGREHPISSQKEFLRVPLIEKYEHVEIYS